jgi:uncharacterized RDD family membrane protein YckC
MRTTSSTPSSTRANGRRRPARLPHRLAAAGLDTALVLLAVMSVAQPYSYVYVLACLAGYQATMTWLLGRTAGKVVLGLAVVRPGGERIGLLRAVVRAVLAVALGASAGMTAWSVPFDRRRRMLHDLAAGTMVVIDTAAVSRAADLAARLQASIEETRAAFERRARAYAAIAALLGWLAGGARLVRTLLERLIPGLPEGREPSAVEVLADQAMAKVVVPALAVVPAALIAVVPQAAAVRDELTKPRMVLRDRQPAGASTP